MDPTENDAVTEAEDPAPPGIDAPDRGRIILAAVLFEGALAPLALVLGRLFGQSPLEGFSWSGRDALLGAAAALPMLGSFLAAIRCPFGPLVRIRQILDEIVVPWLKGRPASDLALIALAAGVGEEMLFRGVFQGALAAKLGTWWGLAAASLLFGLLHPITLVYIAIAGLLGAYLGALWIVSGNLLTAIVAHAVYDFLAVVVLLREPESSTPGSD